MFARPASDLPADRPGYRTRLSRRSLATDRPRSAARSGAGSQGCPGAARSERATNSVVRIDEKRRRLLYRTDTVPGASGAPCFDIDWRFVAMHLAHSYEQGQRKDWDGYALWLHQVLSSRLDVPAVFEYFSIVRYNENGKDICAIHVQPSEQPVFLGKDFYMRVGNKNQPLSGHDLLAYVASRWSWLGSRLQHKQSPSSPPPA